MIREMAETQNKELITLSDSGAEPVGQCGKYSLPAIIVGLAISL